MKTRMPYSQISREALPPRISVLGYVKVGGLEDRIRYTKKGKPWVAPQRWVDPVRFEVTTRQQRIEEIEGKGPDYKGKKIKVGRGYVRDEAIHEVIGERPTEIEVRFMFPRAADNFVSHFGAHSGKQWICQGDGVEAQDVARGAVACPCPRLKQFEGQYEGPYPTEGQKRLVACKPRGVLSFIIPAAETFGGFYVFKTTSWESIANLRTQLEVFESHFKRVDGLPFVLKVYPATKSYDNGEGTTTQPIVTLVIPADFDTARQLAAAAAEESQRYLLTAGGAPDPVQHRSILEREMREEAAAEGAEFHPDAGKPKQAPLEDVNAKIRARGEGKPLPVVEGTPTQPQDDDEGDDYEVADPDDEPWDPDDVEEVEPESGGEQGEEEQEERLGPRTGRSRAELNRIYFAELGKKKPEWGDAERKFWQEQRVGKASCREWEVDDFELALVLIERGLFEYDVPRTRA